MGKTQIPTASRVLVKHRDHESCVRCGMKPPTLEWHHRRGRAVDDEHQHCPCNGISLCNACHRWAHSKPFEARRLGFIVARHITTPGSQPVWSVVYGKWCVLDCEGSVEFSNDPPPA